MAQLEAIIPVWRAQINNKRLLIVGGGFAGVWAALGAARQRHLQNSEFEITLITKDPFLTIRPRLYERDPEKLRVPLSLTLDPVNVNVIEGCVVEIDSGSNVICYEASNKQQKIAYDKLVLAAGSQLTTLPIPGADEHTWNIDTYRGAIEFDEHLKAILKSSTDGAKTFTIIGAGFTGIELATELRSRIEAHHDKMIATEIEIILVDRTQELAKELGDNLRPHIVNALNDANVNIRLGVEIKEVNANAIYFAGAESIKSKTVINTAGLQANPLTKLVSPNRDLMDRLMVDEFLRVTDNPNIYACGDVACANVDESHKVLMSCQHAMPMGRFAGFNAANDLLGRELRPYRQPNYVTCLDLGLSGAVFSKGWGRKVEMTGVEAKQLKQTINKKWIYPPIEDVNSILQAADIQS